LREADLATLPKGDPRKLALAAHIRQRTSVPTAWIAERLHLGHVSRVGHAVRLAAGTSLLQQLDESTDAAKL